MGSWTEEKVVRLKMLHSANYSMARIADILGDGTTKNAVIGKLNRLKLLRNGEDRVARIKRALKSKKQKPGAMRATKKRKPLERQERQVPEHDRRTAGQLLDDQCRWPIGDPQEQGFHYCNAKKLHGSSYCKEHAAIARRQDKPRKQRKPEPSGIGFRLSSSEAR